MDRRTALLSFGVPFAPLHLLLSPLRPYEVTQEGETYGGLLYYDRDLEPDEKEMLYECLWMLHIDPDFNAYFNFNVVVGDEDMQARIHCYPDATAEELEKQMRSDDDDRFTRDLQTA